MKKILFILVTLFILTTNAIAQYDIVIVGGNPGGIMSAIAAAKLGKTSLILERTNHIGGLPANGLGATDIATRGATNGLFKDFIARIKEYYIKKYGVNSVQVKDCSDGYHFEPSVAELIFNQMLNEYSSKIKVLLMRQFDSKPENVSMENDRIQSIKILNRVTGKQEEYTAKIFIDGTYEGDLGAAAKLPYRVGREGKDEFNEPGAGQTYKYWDGPETNATTYLADNAVQAYNYRLCLTNDKRNLLPVPKPKHYIRDEYISLIDDVWFGRHAGVEMLNVTSQQQTANKIRLSKGDSTSIPGDKWGIAKITNMVVLPNHKTDANNQHLALISTDLPEENWPWPTADWKWRDAYSDRLKNYTLGLLWFAQNDKELPLSFRTAASRWGFAKDEYTDNNNFPRQVYVREGRRFEGIYFFTANDALSVSPGQRPPVHAESVTASHYALDSHAVKKRERDKATLDGFISYESAVYTVPFGVMASSKIDNLLFPVPVSGSHIGFSTLRMEPCWMALGQAAGVAASIAIDSSCKVKNTNLEQLQDILLDQNATLIYYKDISPDDPDYKMVEYLGLRGYLPNWNADLNSPISEETLLTWRKISDIKLDEIIPNQTNRKEALKIIYNLKIKNYHIRK